MECRVYYLAAVEILVLAVFAFIQVYFIKRLILKGRIV